MTQFFSCVVCVCVAKDKEGSREERGEEDGGQAADGSERTERQVSTQLQPSFCCEYHYVCGCVQREAAQTEEEVGEFYPLRKEPGTVVSSAPKREGEREEGNREREGGERERGRGE